MEAVRRGTGVLTRRCDRLAHVGAPQLTEDLRVALFKRKGNAMIAEIEREIDTFEQRRAKLQEQLQQSEAELATTIRERQARMVETDTDEHTNGREQVANLRDRVADLHDALSTIGDKVTEERGRLAAERDRVARQVEVEARTKQLESVREALKEHQAAAARLIAALEPLSVVNIEVAGCARKHAPFDRRSCFRRRVGFGPGRRLLQARCCRHRGDRRLTVADRNRIAAGAGDRARVGNDA
jgi:hypothetical protein